MVILVCYRSLPGVLRHLKARSYDRIRWFDEKGQGNIMFFGNKDVL